MGYQENFRWLHLSDLHYSTETHESYWPNVREKFFNQLKLLYENYGSWQVVCFTGDLVNNGRKEEFEELDKKVLFPMWDLFEDLGFHPDLLVVPGNHDLVRPSKRRAALKGLVENDLYHEEIENALFDDQDSDYYQLIYQAFEPFQIWWENHKLNSAKTKVGYLPGDFSITYQVGSKKIGFVGLNSSFLQLASGNFEGRLSINIHQFHRACNGFQNGTEWANHHDILFLLTHHGQEWLDKISYQNHYNEINPLGRFNLHLYGHNHSNIGDSTSSFGGESQRLRWQSTSLFSKEESKELSYGKRNHGFTLGEIKFSESEATMKLVPYRSTPQSNDNYKFHIDSGSCAVDERNKLKEVKIHFNKSLPKTNENVTNWTLKNHAHRRLLSLTEKILSNKLIELDEDVENVFRSMKNGDFMVLVLTNEFPLEWSSSANESLQLDVSEALIRGASFCYIHPSKELLDKNNNTTWSSNHALFRELFLSFKKNIKHLLGNRKAKGSLLLIDHSNIEYLVPYHKYAIYWQKSNPPFYYSVGAFPILLRQENQHDTTRRLVIPLIKSFEKDLISFIKNVLNNWKSTPLSKYSSPQEISKILKEILKTKQ